MAADFPYLYPYSRADARRLRQTQMHEDSFRVNVDCARAIEQAVRDHFNAADESLAPPSASQSILRGSQQLSRSVSGRITSTLPL